MADGVPITAGTGTTIATDEIGTVHYQRVKLVSGTLEATDAIPGDAAFGLDVDVTRLPALVAGSANIGDVDVLTLPALVAGTANIGDVDVLTLPALVAGTALIGKVGIDQTTPGTTNAVVPQPATSGGTLDYHVVSAVSTNAANVKPIPGQLYGLHGLNIAIYPIFVKFHNTAGTPTAGAGVVHSAGVQAGMRIDAHFPEGIQFSTGIGITITKLGADNDTTAVAAGDFVGDVLTK